MTMDKSLRVRKGSSSARGVLSRGERILKLKEQECRYNACCRAILIRL